MTVLAAVATLMGGFSGVDLASATSSHGKPVPAAKPAPKAHHYAGPRTHIGAHGDKQQSHQLDKSPTSSGSATSSTSSTSTSTSSTSCGNPNLCNEGGPVMSDITVYNVYWLPDGTASPNQALINQFTQDLGGPFVGMLNQYGVPNRVSFGGSWVDTNPYPTTLHDGNPVITDAGMQQAASDAASNNPGWKAPSLGTMYMVYLGQHTELCNPDIGCTYTGDFCAYHGSFVQDSAQFVYGAMPFDGDRLNGCGIQNTPVPGSTGSPGPNGDTANDAEISTASHEMFEAFTDPLVNVNTAWQNGVNPLKPDFLKGEIGDMCAYVFNPDTDHGNVTLNGDRYFIQEEWDNATSSCILPSGALLPLSTSAGCLTNTLPANDDGSTDSVALPFTINFFGNQRSSLWVNNNGDVTFDAPLSTFTPFPLLSTSREIIAPYFADVDTRGGTPVPSGLVTYGTTTYAGHQAFCVNWRNVGFYYMNNDKPNSFQMLLVDRSDVGAGDFDIVFNYDRVQWETGDASNGTDGLGGGSARVGFSNGVSNSLELFDSGVNGALLDYGAAALTGGSHGSSQPGRYIFPVRNGTNAGGASVAGTVTDAATGHAVVGAEVQVCGGFLSTIVCDITQTNSTGGYSVTSLPGGFYEVTVSPPAGSSLFQQSQGLILLADGSATLDFVLAGPAPLPNGTSFNGVTSSDVTPTVFWHSSAPLTTHGCAGGIANWTVTAEDSTTGQQSSLTGNLPESPVGSGTYSGDVSPLWPLHGGGTLTITFTCPNSADNGSISFDIYIDPSGVVQDTHGNPISGATVTLYRSDDPAGPFTQVPDGSALMSPGNRANPDSTNDAGQFGWDVVSGYYKVTASKTGCASPTDSTQTTVSTDVLTIPPAISNLTLTLNCDTTTGDTTPPVVVTSPLTVEANATGGYTGTLTGVSATDPDDATSSLTLTNDAPTLLPLGANTVNWTAKDPAGNSASAPQTVTVQDTTPPSITCPSDVSTTWSATPALGTASATDVADANPVISNDAPSSFLAGRTTVKWTATDHSGNPASCYQTVDLQGPTSIIYTGTQLSNVGTALQLKATVSSPVSNCRVGSVQFALDRNPVTGATGSYTIGTGTVGSSGAVSTTAATIGWQEGVYQLTAAYSGPAYCNVSSDLATLTMAGAGAAATGGGWYTLPGSGRSNFGFTVRKQSDGSYKGQFVLVNNGKWRVVGSLTNYGKTSKSGAVNGTGRLYWWDPTANGGLGDWVLSESAATFSASFTDNGTGGKTADTFGVHINHVIASYEPQTLPNSTPVTIKGGDIKVS